MDEIDNQSAGLDHVTQFDNYLTGLDTGAVDSNHRNLEQPLARIIFVNIALIAFLYALSETALHVVSFNANPLTRPPNQGLRVSDEIYHHTLKPNFSGMDLWGASSFAVKTNSLGFRDSSTRDVPLVERNKTRILFIGDSFTEGIGVPYEETFVGRFANAFPEIDVLNAGVVSYAPSVYYEKLRYYLEVVGLHFDEAFVYIDISDIQDEAISYYYDERGMLHGPAPWQWQWSRKEKFLWEKIFYIPDFLNQWRLAREWRASMQQEDLENILNRYRENRRASWTYDSNTSGYGSLGVEGGIRKAKQQMDRIYQLLSKHGVALSVGVYPWPQQLLYDVENSRQVQIWRDWCIGKCNKFFDHFPAFSQYKAQNSEYIRQLFIYGDVHYNAEGNRLLADDLIRKFNSRF